MQKIISFDSRQNFYIKLAKKNPQAFKNWVLTTDYR